MHQNSTQKTILITGSNGFIGRNLLLNLKGDRNYRILTFNRQECTDQLPALIALADIVVHLAGVNRPNDVEDFNLHNNGLTEDIVLQVLMQVRRSGKRVPIIFSSSTKALDKSPYGISKRKSELALVGLAKDTNNPLIIYRLPGVFGKWCKPNYNSVVATFCNNVANNIPIKIDDTSALIDLVYIDDVISAITEDIRDFFAQHKSRKNITIYRNVTPIYKISIGDLADKIAGFKALRQTLFLDDLAFGLDRALYATFLSYYSPNEFAYNLDGTEDSRGGFFEVFKTQNSGQCSYVKIPPGATRGGHYHNTKSEKFIVAHGSARMSFENVLSGERYELTLTSEKPQIVDTVPGWAHNITNIGHDVAIVLLWASEVFDPNCDDTIAHDF